MRLPRKAVSRNPRCGRTPRTCGAFSSRRTMLAPVLPSPIIPSCIVSAPRRLAWEKTSSSARIPCQFGRPCAFQIRRERDYEGKSHPDGSGCVFCGSEFGSNRAIPSACPNRRLGGVHPSAGEWGKRCEATAAGDFEFCGQFVSGFNVMLAGEHRFGPGGERLEAHQTL